MTEFTREDPFEFEGVKVWRGGDGHLKCFGGFTNEGQARAYHAFIEAERDSWHYTNDDHIERMLGVAS